MPHICPPRTNSTCTWSLETPTLLCPGHQGRRFWMPPPPAMVTVPTANGTWNVQHGGSTAPAGAGSHPGSLDGRECSRERGPRSPPATWPHSVSLLASGTGPFFGWSSVLNGKQIVKEMRGQEGGISEPWRGERASPRDGSSAGGTGQRLGLHYWARRGQRARGGRKPGKGTGKGRTRGWRGPRPVGTQGHMPAWAATPARTL